MSLFRYEAVDQAGKIVMGAMDAPNEAAVSARLSQMGYRPQRVHASNGAGPQAAANQKTGVQPAQTGAAGQAPSKTAFAAPKDMALFFRQFATLVRSGITLFQSLESLGPRTQNQDLSRSAKEMADNARNGASISDVMEKYPRIFAPHVVASVRGGEKGGFLEIVLDEIALEYEQEVAFYKGLWLAKWGVAQGIAAIAIAQPVFPNLFPEPHVDVYFKLLFFRNIPIAIGFYLLARLFVNWLRQPAQTELRGTWMLKLPAFGDLARQRSLAAFVRMLRKLFAAGLGPISAWEGAMNVAPNSVIRRKLVEAYDIMQHNVPLHDAFAQTGLFANEAEQLLATGMVSGAMVDMLDRVADFYQNNVDRAYDTSRYVMKRIVGVTVIVLGGFMIIMLFKNYFASIFSFADKFAE
jgi:type IV pilus assembly protein PilC